MATEQPRESTRDIATEALVRNLISLGVALTVAVGAAWLTGQRWRAEHALWRLRERMRARQRAEDAAVAELRADVSRWEHAGGDLL